ncbi:MAG: hypothetical protein ACYTHJ_20950 [Planctomycetota bacterium]
MLTVGGTAELAGELRVQAIDDFVPAGSDAIAIITATDVQGMFDTVDLPDGFALEYGTTEVIIRRAQPTADFSNDGLINLLDFAILQSCFAGPGQHTFNTDLDQDADVDLEDFELFRIALVGG